MVLRRCGDAVACWELECDDACRGRAGVLGALVWMGGWLIHRECRRYTFVLHLVKAGRPPRELKPT